MNAITENKPTIIRLGNHGHRPPAFRHLGQKFLLPLLLLILALNSRAEQFGEFTYSVAGGEATITFYPRDARGHVVVPADFDGVPVTAIGPHSFSGCGRLSGITLPTSVVSIGECAFEHCGSVTELPLPPARMART